MSAPTWSNERRKLSELIPWPRNPRQIKGESVRRLQESFEEFGQPEVIAISPANEVYNGHQRLKSWAAKFGDIEVDVRVSSRPLTEKERERLTVLLHRGAVGEWDFDMLANEFEVGELLDWGFTEMELGLDGGAANNVDAEPQIDRAEELNEKWQVQPCDLWRIGEHRLICGDCTDAAVVERVMGGERANLIFTSPPYAMQREKMYGGIPADQYVEWWGGVQAIAKDILHDDGSFFVNIKPNALGLDRELYVFDLVLAMVRNWEWHFAEEFCWERAGLPQQVVRRFKNQFEPIYQFVKSEWKFRPEAVRFESDRVPKAMGKGAGDTNAAKRQGKMSAVHGNTVDAGLAYPGNRIPTFQDVTQIFGHPAIFPTGLVSFFIKAFTDNGDVLFEPFSGSGTAINACENLGRRCRAVEISPGYVAVALERMATAFPGIVIERVSDDG